MQYLGLVVVTDDEFYLDNPSVDRGSVLCVVLDKYGRGYELDRYCNPDYRIDSPICSVGFDIGMEVLMVRTVPL